MALQPGSEKPNIGAPEDYAAEYKRFETYLRDKPDAAKSAKKSFDWASVTHFFKGSN